MGGNKLLDFGFENIDLWRSEEMELVSLMIPAESAHDTVWALGEIGLLQFIDLNEDKSAFQRTFASQVRWCRWWARNPGLTHQRLRVQSVLCL
jgi:V-type H+-transporting ATPase subunit a